jgi:hypothetical protein
MAEAGNPVKKTEVEESNQIKKKERKPPVRIFFSMGRIFDTGIDSRSLLAHRTIAQRATS